MADQLLKKTKQLAKANNFQGIIKLYGQVIGDIPLSDKESIAGCYFNMASTYTKMNKYAEAEQMYKNGLINSESEVARYSMSIVQLHQNKLVEGFANYDHRWATDELKPLHSLITNFGVPHVKLWHEVVGKRVFVVSEQGLGDCIMFSRALGELEKVATSVGYSVYKELTSLVAYNYPKIDVWENEDFKSSGWDFMYKEYDVIMTDADLFRAYVLQFDKVPPINKLHSHSEDEWPIEEKTIGYVYLAGNRGDNGKARSVPMNTLKFLNKNDYRIFNFQLDTKVPYAAGNVGVNINSFMDTAVLLESIENVVTVDTSFMHLSLSMDKPTVVLYDRYLDWRLKVGLYPKARLLSIQDRQLQEKLVKSMES